MSTYMNEAHPALAHITSLSRTLAAVRRPYLDVHARPPPPSSKSTSRNAELTETTEDLDRMWTDVGFLSNEERDQIDMQARIVLSRCAERVRAMEALEKRRSDLASSQHTPHPLHRLLPARLLASSSSSSSSSSTSSSDFIAAHNASVTFYLTRRLAQTSQSLRDMQEERVRRQTERSASLGSGAAREAAYIAAGASSVRQGSGGGGSGSGWGSWIATPSSSEIPEVYDLTDEDEEEDEDLDLSASQIQQFESENAHILRAAEHTLAAVHQAETRLLEIASLQAELVAQLARQSEVTDRLFDDAVNSSEMVERGNVQLREARRRAGDSRLWILIFLVGASLSLLFLHYY